MNKLKIYLSLILSTLILLTLFCGCGSKEEEVIIPDEDGWFACWWTVPEQATGDRIPTNPSLRGSTCRQVIRPSIGGSKIKLTFSNEYGNIPLVIESVHISKLVNPGTPSIDPESDTKVTFFGKDSVTIAEGKTVVSDEIFFGFEALEDITVTIKVGDYTGGEITCHGNANIQTWIVEGDHVSDTSLSGVRVASSWYYLVGMQTWAEAGTKTLVAIGDSITDRTGATYTKYKSWTDQLDLLIKSNPMYDDVSIVNMGLSGSLLCGDGNSVASRLERDVFSVPGIRYLVVLAGINDIANAQSDITSELINAYKDIIDRCHKKGIKVYGGTVTPVKGNFIYSELHERIRNKLNDFIISEDSGLDGFIDFSNAVADPDDRSSIKEEFLSTGRDHIHLGDKGYEEMAFEAYRRLLRAWEFSDEISN